MPQPFPDCSTAFKLTGVRTTAAACRPPSADHAATAPLVNRGGCSELSLDLDALKRAHRRTTYYSPYVACTMHYHAHFAYSLVAVASSSRTFFTFTFTVDTPLMRAMAPLKRDENDEANARRASPSATLRTFAGETRANSCHS